MHTRGSGPIDAQTDVGRRSKKTGSLTGYRNTAGVRVFAAISDGVSVRLVERELPLALLDSAGFRSSDGVRCNVLSITTTHNHEL
jgi:hypothetical protein